MYKQSDPQIYATLELETNVMNASPHQLIVLLFDGALSALKLATLYIEQGNIAAKGAAISKAISIISTGLNGSLDHSQGGELSEHLEALYDYMMRRLLLANLHNDVEIIKEVQCLLSDIAGAWREIGTA